MCATDNIRTVLSMSGCVVATKGESLKKANTTVRVYFRITFVRKMGTHKETRERAPRRRRRLQ